MASHFIRVAGVSYRQDAVAKCQVGLPVSFEPEPDNPHDPHACKVMVMCADGLQHVGYVPAHKVISFKNAILSNNYKGAVLAAVARPKPEKPLGLQVRIDFDGKLPEILH